MWGKAPQLLTIFRKEDCVLVVQKLLVREVGSSSQNQTTYQLAVTMISAIFDLHHLHPFERLLACRAEVGVGQLLILPHLLGHVPGADSVCSDVRASAVRAGWFFLFHVGSREGVHARMRIFSLWVCFFLVAASFASSVPSQVRKFE